MVDFIYRVDATGVTEDINRTISVHTSDFGASCRHRFEHGSSTIDLIISDTSTGSFETFTSSVNSYTLTIVGVKPQHIVQDSVQVSQGNGTANLTDYYYMDVGDTRFISGRFDVPSVGVETVTFPEGGFKTGTVPIVTVSLETIENNANDLVMNSVATATTFEVNIDNSQNIANSPFVTYMAMGLKP